MRIMPEDLRKANIAKCLPPEERPSGPAGWTEEEAPISNLNLVVQKSTDVGRLNKTEFAFYQRLKLLHPYDWVGVQCITLKLADDTRYTPDFIHVHIGQLLAYETKGWMRDDARVKLTVAARQFPWIEFLLVRRTNGDWDMKSVKP